jgi:hypothetical protein
MVDARRALSTGPRRYLAAPDAASPRPVITLADLVEPRTREVAGRWVRHPSSSGRSCSPSLTSSGS